MEKKFILLLGHILKIGTHTEYIVAKVFGLTGNPDGNEGTFTNFAQNDQALYALHTYLMYLKFGFGEQHKMLA